MRDYWNSIVWRQVIQRVHRLQRRIAKAVKEGRWGKAKALMYLVSKSFYAKLLAVFRVTSNKGGKTPEVDNIVWENDLDKLHAARSLKARSYTPMPLRRVYILKKNGKKLQLSIPSMYDRAMKALYAIALDPVAETTAYPNSYGFREKRSCADAIAQCFLSLCRETLPHWVFEADIKSCFDQVDHEYGSGWNGNAVKKKRFPRRKGQKVNFIRYVNDFIITKFPKIQG